jgi:hypothetical protein
LHYLPTIAQEEVGTGKWRECTGQPLPARLVTSTAGGKVNGFAPGYYIVQRPAGNLGVMYGSIGYRRRRLVPAAALPTGLHKQSDQDQKKDSTKTCNFHDSRSCYF